MRVIAPLALEAMARGDALSVGAVKIACTPPVLVWGGYHPITLAGEVYQPIGDRGLVTVSAAALGDSEQNVTLTLSGIEPDAAALNDAQSLRGAPVMVWRLIYDGAGRTLLDAGVYTRGRLDQVKREETIGGTARIDAMVETAARGLGRSGKRMRTDADMRLVDPNDNGFKGVSFAGVKTLYWGGKRPATAGAVANGGNVRKGGLDGLNSLMKPS